MSHPGGIHAYGFKPILDGFSAQAVKRGLGCFWLEQGMINSLRHLGSRHLGLVHNCFLEFGLISEFNADDSGVPMLSALG